MNNKLKQKILKEINYLLREDQSDPLKAGAAVAGAGALGAAGIGAGLAASGATISGMGIGAGALAGLGAVALPLAVAGLAVAAIYNIFRKAGWQEVAQDIQDASSNMQERPELAAKLPTNGYFDLTTMKDATDKKDFESLMTAMEKIRGAITDQPNLEGVAGLINDLRSQKPILDKMCGVQGTTSKGGYFLLNEFGLNDRMYHVKCARIAIKNIPEELIKKLQSGEIKLPEESSNEDMMPASDQVQEALRYLKKILKEETATAPATSQAAPVTAPVAPLKCSDSAEVFFIPVSFDTVGLEDEIADSPVKLKDPSISPLPTIVSPLIEKVCQLVETIKPDQQPVPPPSPVPGSDGGEDTTPRVSCVRCKGVGLGCKGKAVKEIHDKLIALKLMNTTNPSQGNVGMSMGGGEIQAQLFGKATEEAIINFQKSKKLKVDGIVGKNTSKALGIKCGSGGGSDDKGSGVTCPDGTPAPGGDVKKCSSTPGPTPGPTPEPQQSGMNREEVINAVTFKQLADNVGGTQLNIFKKAAKYLIDVKKMSPQQAFDAITKITGPNGSNIPQRTTGIGGDANLAIIKKAKKDLEALTGLTATELNSQSLNESKKFKYENYYDSKKEVEAKLLFEKLIKKL